MQKEIEVMRVVRVPPMGSLVVVASGRRLKQLNSAGNDQVKQRLLAAIGELVAFAGGYDALVDAGVAPPLASSRAAETSVGGEVSEEQLTEQQTAFLDQLQRGLKGTGSSQLAATNEPLTAADPEPVAASNPAAASSHPGGNLVGEIDAILQKQLSADPDLAGRHVHLRQPPGGTLQIVVDSSVYEHPNQIEDEAVRQALKRALKK